MKVSVPVLMLLALFVAGCIGPATSLHPLYEGTDIVSAPEVLGGWEGEDNNWLFTDDADEGYRCVMTNKDGEHVAFIVRPVRIDGTLYFDTIPEEAMDVSSGFYRMHLLPVHGIMRVDELGKRMRLSMLETDWVNNETQRNALGVIEHESGLLITAQPETLRQLLSRAAEDAWKEAGVWNKI